MTIKPNHNKVPPQADLLKLMPQATDYRMNEEDLSEDNEVKYHQRVLQLAVSKYYGPLNKEIVVVLFGDDPVNQLFYSEGKIIFLGRACEYNNDKYRLFNFEIKLNDSNKNIVENYIANSDERFKEDLFVAVCHLIENADPSCEEHLDSPWEFIDMNVKGYDEQFEKDFMIKYNTDLIHPPSRPYLYNGRLISIFDLGHIVANTCVNVKQTDKGYEIIGGIEDT
ncbi:MAG: hypothetical protein RRZ69_05755, partial [Clostridia bacterium]